MSDTKKDCSAPAVEKKPNFFVAFFNDKLKPFLIKVLPNKSKSKKENVIRIVLISAVVLLIAAIIYLTIYYISFYQNKKVVDDTRNIYNLNRDNYSYNDQGIYSKFDELLEHNPDIVGWVSVNNTEIDLPIYKASDNDYYLNRDANGKFSGYGSLFMDYRCDIVPYRKSQNLIVYGHHMQNGTMFGNLTKYKKLDFYKASPIVTFDSLYEAGTYKIFALMITTNDTDYTYGYGYSPYQANFETQEEFLKWVEYSKQRSLVETNVDVKEFDEVITLSTCCYDFTDARFVVLARKVRDGESSDVDTTNTKANAKVIYPEAYYKKKGLKVPTVS